MTGPRRPAARAAPTTARRPPRAPRQRLRPTRSAPAAPASAPEGRAQGSERGPQTRQRLLEAALLLFRQHGFDATTMRDIAAAAGLSLGASYYYFPSKEDLLLAYYERRAALHASRARSAMAGAGDLRARVAAVVLGGLDVDPDDRKLLGALARSLGDPNHPLSAFGSRTGAIRRQSLALFDEALQGSAVPDDLRRLLGPALWLLYLGLVLYYVRDESPGQRRTRRLIDDGLGLLAGLVLLAGMPALEPVRSQLQRILRDAGLIEPAPPP